MKFKFVKKVLFSATLFLSLGLLSQKAVASDSKVNIIDKEVVAEDMANYTLVSQEYSSISDAIDGISDISREAMINRFDEKIASISFSVSIEASKDDYDKSNFCSGVKDKIFVEETKNPNAGHTLSKEYVNCWVYWVDEPTYGDNSITGDIYIQMNHTTPNDRYKQFQEEAAEVIESLDLDGKSDYEKVQLISDWVGRNISYEDWKEDGVSMLVSTLSNKKSNCQGYADLTYYLMNSVGIDTFEDSGRSNTALHAWNLVKLDGKYYYLDNQGNPYRVGSTYRREFLHGSKDFDCYPESDIAENYPIAEYMYSKDNSSCNGNHDMEKSLSHLVCFLYDEYTCKNCCYSYRVYSGEEKHNWDNGVVTQEADCTHEEITTYSCKHNCIGFGKKYTKEEVTSPALGHEYSEPIIVAPTCTEKGYTVKTCTREGCGDEVKSDYVNALGHDYVSVETEPTCTEDGYITYTCSRCKDSYTEPSGKTKKGHTCTGKVTKEPSCVEKGIKTYTCKDCEYSYDEDIDALGHDYKVEKEVDATCENDGSIVYKCSRCGDTYTEPTGEKALGHEWGDGVVTKEATCEEKGILTYTCSRCGKTKTEDILATGHKNTEKRDKKEATCEEAGHTGNTYCKDCGKLLIKGLVIDALGHDYDEGVVTKEASHTETGIKKYTCKRCGYEDEVVIPKLTHEHNGYEIKIVKKPTCKETGIERHQCIYCDFYYDVDIPMTSSHSETTISGKKDATCTEPGYTGDTVCEVCGKVIEAGEVIPVKGHSYNNGVVTKEATCSKEGLKVYTCTRCGNEKSETIPINDSHNWGNGEVVSEATCSENGQKKYKCLDCGKERFEIIPSTGEHSWNDGEVVLEATCSENGKKVYTCDKCGETKEEVIAKLPHSYGRWIGVSDATVFAKATHKHVCSRCGNSETVAYGDKVRASLYSNASSLKLKIKQSTSKFRVSFAKGDYVKSWVSSNKNVVTVSGRSNGTCVIKAGKKTGKAYITVTLASGLRKSYLVTVQKSSVATSSISNVPKKVTIARGQKLSLRPVVNPITSTYKAKFKSSNKKIVKVDSKGNIRGMKKGTAKITVTSGKKKVTCVVYVK